VGCKLETDKVWGLQWPFTATGSVAVQKCPGLSKSTGKYSVHTVCRQLKVFDLLYATGRTMEIYIEQFSSL